MDRQLGPKITMVMVHHALHRTGLPLIIKAATVREIELVAPGDLCTTALADKEATASNQSRREVTPQKMSGSLRMAKELAWMMPTCEMRRASRLQMMVRRKCRGREMRMTPS